MHRAVLETFNPIENEECYVVDHIDGIKTNNSLENLRWLTIEDNTATGAANRQKINYLVNELI